jgi:hypothetical protein
MQLLKILGNNIIELQTNDLLILNRESKKYNLYLTRSDAKDFIENRTRILNDFGEIDLENNLLKTIVLTFCDSPFIQQENYAIIINELLETFYFIKSENEDNIGDDELLFMMKSLFNGRCGGSVEYLKDILYDMVLDSKKEDEFY